MLFAIPYECRPTDETVAANQTRWRLVVQARLPGTDYRATFDVPVFKTAESDPNFQLDPATTAAYAAPPDPDRELGQAGVLKTAVPGGEGYEFTFPMCRRLDLPLGCGLFTAFWTGIVVVLFFVKAPLLFPIAFGLANVLMLLIVADLCFYRSVVEASPGGLLLRGGWFGLGRTRRVEAADVAHIKTALGMQSGQAVYYNIIVTDRNGKKFTAAKTSSRIAWPRPWPRKSSRPCAAGRDPARLRPAGSLDSGPAMHSLSRAFQPSLRDGEGSTCPSFPAADCWAIVGCPSGA